MDAELAEPTAIIMIGGAVVCLAFASPRSTRDIDLWQNAEQAFWEACARVDARGNGVPVQVAAVAEAPYTFEDRLRELPLGLNKLRVLVPEAHDLAMMKIARGDQRDLEAVEAIHQASPLVAETLLERFRETEVTGRRQLFEIKLLDAIARLFGEDRARAMEAELARSKEK
ncbi:MAG: hypothetical protein JST54_35535 [Deltaproteobacteria bacterium]|nr:hypothetical protein [Deltaproteobacteria bacterium]